MYTILYTTKGKDRDGSFCCDTRPALRTDLKVEIIQKRYVRKLLLGKWNTAKNILAMFFIIFMIFFLLQKDKISEFSE